MTTGALIFAYNNEEVDYLAMAAWSAENIKRHLNIPVAVVTNAPADQYACFAAVIHADTQADNYRYFHDYKKDVTWYNGNRMDAYNLSPWDQTLVLDADYVVASNQLKVLLDADCDFMCHRWAYDITGLTDFKNLNYFGQYRFSMWWATVMMFRRSTQAELIFNSMQMIRDNWQHYRNLYQNPQKTYRNDHSLSIALNIENGHTLHTQDIPWPLASLTPAHKLKKIDLDRYRVDFTTPDGNSKWIEITQDLHAMGKRQLGEIVANNS